MLVYSRDCERLRVSYLINQTEKQMIKVDSIVKTPYNEQGQVVAIDDDIEMCLVRVFNRGNYWYYTEHLAISK